MYLVQVRWCSEFKTKKNAHVLFPVGMATTFGQLNTITGLKHNSGKFCSCLEYSVRRFVLEPLVFLGGNIVLQTYLPNQWEEKPSRAVNRGRQP